MLIPALDLINGQVVRLQQGDFNRQTTYSATPHECALAYEDEGAQYLHLVDLDGARDPNQRQLTVIRQIVQATSLPIQVGGGIRTAEDIEQLLELGVQRVVIGSVAVTQPQHVQQWLRTYGPNAIVVAIDGKLAADGTFRVATHGWHQTSSLTLNEVLDELLPAGLRHLLCTDIERDGMLTGPNLTLYQQLKQRYPTLKLQGSGGIASLADFTALRAIACDSVILGKALLNGKFTLKEALACWQNESSLV